MLCALHTGSTVVRLAQGSSSLHLYNFLQQDASFLHRCASRTPFGIRHGAPGVPHALPMGSAVVRLAQSECLDSSGA
eukprot:1161878-Pelagomonas_calceolata.AAC.11